jgi:hypothetical protein
MSNETFGEPIYTYTRRQAIEDGVLVDLSRIEVVRQHWKYPFACTTEVWAIIEVALEKPGQDVAGICHDISSMAKLAIHRAKQPDLINFEVFIAGHIRRLKLHCGPGDDASPVLTLMLPNQD